MSLAFLKAPELIRAHKYVPVEHMTSKALPEQTSSLSELRRPACSKILEVKTILRREDLVRGDISNSGKMEMDSPPR